MGQYFFNMILTGSASREAVSCKALVRQGSHSTLRASNTADGRLSPCPKGATQQPQRRVAPLDKGPAIACERASPKAPTVGALALLCDSEPVNIMLKKY
jgi:hypothetical protein